MVTNNRKNICVIVPVHNEQGNIAHLAERALRVIAGINSCSFWILFVDDGSTDNSLAEIEKLVKQNLPVGYLQLSRNFGHQSALEAGFSVVDADAVITMDGDLQHPPEEIVRMVEAFNEGADVVQMQRKNIGQDFKGVLSLSYYTFFKWISNAPLVPNAADFRLVSRRVVKEISKMQGKGKLLRAIIPAMGFKQVCLEYMQDERKYGRSSYSYFMLYDLAMETTFKFSRFPAHFTTISGSFFIAGGMLLLLLGALHLVPAWHYVLIISLFSLVIGCIFLAAGIICWYLYFILEQVRHDPPFIIKKEVYPTDKTWQR